jgi:hypothetical protein
MRQQRRFSVRRIGVIIFCALVLPAATAQAWSWPVDGPVLHPFVFDPAHPYAAGQHRGIDIGGPAGAPVRAPIDGVVSFAGTVPTGGKTVAIETQSGYTATLLHLGSIEVKRGGSVVEGQTEVGTIGAVDGGQPYVYFGVRVTGEQQGYVDPLTLLPAAPPADQAPPASQASEATVAAPAPGAEPAAPGGDEPVSPVADPPSVTGGEGAASAPTAGTAESAPPLAEPGVGSAEVPSGSATSAAAGAGPAASTPPSASPQAGVDSPAQAPAQPSPAPVAQLSDANEPTARPSLPAPLVLPTVAPNPSADLTGLTLPAPVPGLEPITLAGAPVERSAAVALSTHGTPASVERSTAATRGSRLVASRKVRPGSSAVSALGAGRRVQARTESSPGSSSVPRDTLVAALFGAICGAIALLLRRLRRPERAKPTRIMFVPFGRTAAEEDSRRTGVAVCERSATPGACRGLRGARGHLRALPPLEGQRRPNGERDGRARDAGDGRGGPRRRLAA